MLHGVKSNPERCLMETKWTFYSINNDNLAIFSRLHGILARRGGINARLGRDLAWIDPEILRSFDVKYSISPHMEVSWVMGAPPVLIYFFPWPCKPWIFRVPSIYGNPKNITVWLVKFPTTSLQSPISNLHPLWCSGLRAWANLKWEFPVGNTQNGYQSRT